MRPAVVLLFLALLSWLSLSIATPLASAHTPLVLDGNDSLEGAVPIADPSKSWAIYGTLPGPETAQYYSFEVEEGEQIHLAVLSSSDPDQRDYVPGLALMGPGLAGEGVLPAFVTVPDGSFAVVVNVTRPDQATYEPFGPGSYYDLGSLDLLAPSNGTYYAAVYSALPGNYGLVVGYREAFSLDEWIRLPLTLISVYRWEGQNLALIFFPLIAVMAAGVYLIRRRGLSLSQTRWMASVAGLLFMGSGASVLYQIGFTLTRAPVVPEVAISLFLGLVPVGLGVGTTRIALGGRGDFSKMEKLKLRILGLAALVFGAGLLVGPLLVVTSSTLQNADKGHKGVKGRRTGDGKVVKKGKRS